MSDFDEITEKIFDGLIFEGLFARDERGDVTFSAYSVAETNPHTAYIHDKSLLRQVLVEAKKNVGKFWEKGFVVLPGVDTYLIRIIPFAGFVRMDVYRGSGDASLEAFKKNDGTGAKAAYRFSPITYQQIDRIIKMLAD